MLPLLRRDGRGGASLWSLFYWVPSWILESVKTLLWLPASHFANGFLNVGMSSISTSWIKSFQHFYDNISRLYEFPIATVTNYHNLSGFRQYIRSEVWKWVSRGWNQGVGGRGAVGENPFPTFSSLGMLLAFLGSWSPDSIGITPASASMVISPASFLQRDPCNYTRLPR